MASSSKLVVLAPRALLPDRDEPCPATIKVDTATGRITAVHDGVKRDLAVGGQVLEVPEPQILLPGLIE